MQQFWFSGFFDRTVFMFTLVNENLLTSEIMIPKNKLALIIHKYIAQDKSRIWITRMP
jgi:hypothetical protein